jgi:hypothetical protein
MDAAAATAAAEALTRQAAAEYLRLLEWRAAEHRQREDAEAAAAEEGLRRAGLLPTWKTMVERGAGS